MFRLDGKIQNYAWGTIDAFATMRNSVRSGEPEAELWLGAHPGGPTSVVSDRAGAASTLADLIAADPIQQLGAEVAGRYGGLPFLLKLLAAEEPLSIQTHPSLAQARAGFAREEARGIPRDDPGRVYRDANHKPELICALTPFDLACGFRPLAATRRLFDQLDHRALDPVRAVLAGPGDERTVLAEVLARLLRSRPADAAAIAAATVDAARRCTAELADLDASDALALGWSSEMARAHPGDIGVTVALLLNYVTLAPGEALFLRAGTLHAYLRGRAVEIVANSDNVIRGALTSKHVDVEELLGTVDCTPTAASVLRPTGPCRTYESPIPEVNLTRLELGPLGLGELVTLDQHGPRIIVVTEGEVEVRDRAGGTLRLGPCDAAWLGACDAEVTIAGSGMVFLASL